MITLLKMFGLLWIAPLVQCKTVQLPPLANVSLSWVTDFCYKLSWTPPVENQPCKYEVAMNTSVGPDSESHTSGHNVERKVFLRNTTLRYHCVAMQGALLKLDLSAICGDRRSPPVSTNLTFPELVKDFKCALHSRTSLNCTWRPAQQVADVHLYYWMGDRFGSNASKPNCATTFDLECPVYQTDANGSRTGCVLHNDLPCETSRNSQYGFSCHFVMFLFNSTVDGTLARNTFEKSPSQHMQPPALNWTGEEDYDHNKLTIRWTPVDLPGAWDYILDYTKCGKRVNETMSPVSDHKVLPLDHCAFNITMKAKVGHKGKIFHGESLPGPYRVYGKNTNPHTALILACTLIPGAVVVIVVMAFVCFRRHSESIFPQVPAPQDFLPDMLKNNNDKIHKAIYVPAPEEEPQNVSGKKRKPAWTDRILWRLRPQGGKDQDLELPLKIRQESYNSDMTYSISDHKPVVGLFTLELKKRQQTPLVQLYPEGDWSADMDAMVVYSTLQDFPSSHWDWVGLFKVGFSCVSDYITYAWVKDDEVASSEELVRVYVSKWEIPVLGGECVLCYFSSALHCIIGISQPFKVQMSQVAVEEGLVAETGLPRP